MKIVIGLIGFLFVARACNNKRNSIKYFNYPRIEQSEQTLCLDPKQLFIELGEEKNDKGVKWKMEDPLPLHYMISVDGGPYTSIPFNALKVSSNKDWYLFDMLPDTLSKVCIIGVCTEYQHGMLVPITGEEACHFFIPESRLEGFAKDIVVK